MVSPVFTVTLGKCSLNSATNRSRSESRCAVIRMSSTYRTRQVSFPLRLRLKTHESFGFTVNPRLFTSTLVILRCRFAELWHRP